MVANGAERLTEAPGMHAALGFERQPLLEKIDSREDPHVPKKVPRNLHRAYLKVALEGVSCRRREVEGIKEILRDADLANSNEEVRLFLEEALSGCR